MGYFCIISLVKFMCCIVIV